MSQPIQPGPGRAEETSKPPAQEVNVRFLMIVGVLMMMILALLTGLWLRERVRAARAELALSRVTGRHADLERMVRQLVMAKSLPLQVGREGLAAETVRLNGREVTALRLPPELAEIIGFKGGDVILCDQPPATTTATAPATQAR